MRTISLFDDLLRKEYLACLEDRPFDLLSAVEFNLPIVNNPYFQFKVGSLYFDRMDSKNAEYWLKLVIDHDVNIEEGIHWLEMATRDIHEANLILASIFLFGLQNIPKNFEYYQRYIWSYERWYERSGDSKKSNYLTEPLLKIDIENIVKINDILHPEIEIKNNFRKAWNTFIFSLISIFPTIIIALNLNFSFI